MKLNRNDEFDAVLIRLLPRDISAVRMAAVHCLSVRLSVTFVLLLLLLQWPWNPSYGSLKVNGTDMYRSATDDFLLTFHSSHGPISCRFRDKQRFRSNVAIGNAHARYHVTRKCGCKMITYLESHTPNFLSTVQLSSGYDDDSHWRHSYLDSETTAQCELF